MQFQETHLSSWQQLERDLLSSLGNGSDMVRSFSLRLNRDFLHFAISKVHRGL